MAQPLEDLSELKEFLTLSEVSRLFNVHPNTLRNWDRTGKLKAVRIGARKDRRYRKSDLLAFFYGREPALQSKKGSQKEEDKFSLEDEPKPVGSSLPILREKEEK